MDAEQRKWMRSNITPKAVIEWVTNGSMEKEGWTYNAEIQWMDDQRVLKAGFKTKEEAEEYANSFVNHLINVIYQIVGNAIKDLPKAKE